jgi:hypothetical protein
MVYPTLPTDNILKFFFFATLIAIIFLVNGFDNDVDLYRSKSEDLLLKRIELKYQNKLDSAEIQAIQRIIDTLNSELKKPGFLNSTHLYKELDSNKLLLVKRKMLIEQRVEQLEVLDDRKISLDRELNDNFEETIVFYVVAAAICLLMLLQILTYDLNVHRSNIKKVRKELKENFCQSCGMILKYDLHPHVEAEFCSTCYDGEKFREPDLTFTQMVEKVTENLKAQKLTKRQIKGYTSKIQKLNRWVRTIRWQ